MEFMRFVARNTPFVVRGAAADWKATQTWTVGYLKTFLGDEPVNVAVTPSGYATNPLTGPIPNHLIQQRRRPNALHASTILLLLPSNPRPRQTARRAPPLHHLPHRPHLPNPQPAIRNPLRPNPKRQPAPRIPLPPNRHPLHHPLGTHRPGPRPRRHQPVDRHLPLRDGAAQGQLREHLRAGRGREALCAAAGAVSGGRE